MISIHCCCYKLEHLYRIVCFNSPKYEFLEYSNASFCIVMRGLDLRAQDPPSLSQHVSMQRPASHCIHQPFLAQIRDRQINKAAPPKKTPPATRRTGTSPPPTRAGQKDGKQMTPRRPATPTSDHHTPPVPRRTPQPAARPPSSDRAPAPPDPLHQIGPRHCHSPPQRETGRSWRSTSYMQTPASAYDVRPPLSLRIDRNAAPKPCHTPITIPIQEVKAGLDREVRLGVLEKVPLVTWGQSTLLVTFPPGQCHPTTDKENDLRCMEWLSLRGPSSSWGQALHPTGITLPSGDGTDTSQPRKATSPRETATHRGTTPSSQQNQVHRWCPAVGRWHRGLLPSGSGVAAHLCHEGLNPEKFARFTVTPTEVRPADKFTAAINHPNRHYWHQGLVNQISYTFAMTLPFRDLLKPSFPLPMLTVALATSKQHIWTGVEIFDKGRPTCMATDWSKDGIGFWLTQKHCQCPSRDPFCCRDGWRVTLVGSMRQNLDTPRWKGRPWPLPMRSTEPGTSYSGAGRQAAHRREHRPRGYPEVLKSAKALLNCPCPDTRMSPAMYLFGRPIRDLQPTLPTWLQQPTQDGTTEHTRQTALKKRQSLGKNQHTKGLSPLKRGDRVLVQNQTGHHPTKWDSTGVMVEVMQYQSGWTATAD